MIARRATGRALGQFAQLRPSLRSHGCATGQVVNRWQSTTDQAQRLNDIQQDSATSKAEEHAKATTKPKTQAQLDEELRQKLSAIAGDGGEAGVEYEDGKPVAMKRSVQQNMFRYI